MPITRRRFLRTTGSAALWSAFPLTSPVAAVKETPFTGYGPLQPDPAGVLDLPQGFQYRVLARAGETMSDGVKRPTLADGMAAFPGPGGSTMLCCNHEIDKRATAEYPTLKPGDEFDRASGGGTTALILDRDLKVTRQYVSNAGTARNCAGGPTPWGTWLTCEETEEAGHGYVFEVDPERATSRRLPRLGRFRHEAVAFDPRSGYLYLTEDLADGLLYRFRPAERTRTRLEFGVLEALVVREAPARFASRRPYRVEWVTITNPTPKPDQKTTRSQGRELGAIPFNRSEGICFSAGSIYFTATAGGAKGLGQVWRLTPSAPEDRLELWVESDRPEAMESPDNLIGHSSGDLYLCEDGAGTDRLLGITPKGALFELARVRSESETAGVTFSPDGRALFFNAQKDGLTFVITGPFRSPTGSPTSRRRPPQHLAPRIPGEYRLAAVDRGYNEQEAAALHRLGLPLS
jgi:uncharacterized protein